LFDPGSSTYGKNQDPESGIWDEHPGSTTPGFSSVEKTTPFMAGLRTFSMMIQIWILAIENIDRTHILPENLSSSKKFNS
jgi:hypothetical protein